MLSPSLTGIINIIYIPPSNLDRENTLVFYLSKFYFKISLEITSF